LKKILSAALVPACLATVIACLMAWARSVDPYVRKEFTTRNGDCHCTIVLPKRLSTHAKYPVVMCIRDAREAFSRAPDLRQFADVGLAGVACDFKTKPQKDFQRQLSAVVSYLAKQTWVDGNSIAWMEYSQNPSGTVVHFCEPSSFEPVLLANNGRANETKNYSTFVVENNLGGAEEIAEGNSRVVMRCIAEYCKSKLTPQHPWPEIPRARSSDVYLYLMVPIGAGIFYLWKRRRNWFRIKLPASSAVRFSLSICFISLLSLILWRVLLPTFKITPRTLSLSRKVLVSRPAANDFNCLATLPIWKGQPVGTLLGHVDLANYTVTRLINWKLDRAMYCDYVLSPLIDDTSHLELSWRKQMWKTFWPRVRHENTPQAAAQIVVRCLRERVTIAPDFRKQTGIESVWSTKIANSDDFETVYVAALRSVGIAARLAEDHRAEFWSNNGWSAAPRPPLVTLLRSPAAVDGIASADLERPK
jgi:hypothetical protein